MPRKVVYGSEAMEADALKEILKKSIVKDKPFPRYSDNLVHPKTRLVVHVDGDCRVRAWALLFGTMKPNDKKTGEIWVMASGPITHEPKEKHSALTQPNDPQQQSRK